MKSILNKYNKIALLIPIVLVAPIIFIGIGVYNDDGTGNTPSQDEIDLVLETFRCDRLTEEFLETDKYCNDPKLYFEEFEQGITDIQLN